MPDRLISELPPAIIPLTGSEVLPITQSGVTKKVTAADLAGSGSGSDDDVEGGEITAYDSDTGIATVLLDNGDTVDMVIVPTGGSSGGGGFPIELDAGGMSYQITAASEQISMFAQDEPDELYFAGVSAAARPESGQQISNANMMVLTESLWSFLLMQVRETAPGAPSLIYSDNGHLMCLGVGPGDPNGTIDAQGHKGSLFVDTTTPALWQSTDGVTTWEVIGGLPTTGDIDIAAAANLNLSGGGQTNIDGLSVIDKSRESEQFFDAGNTAGTWAIDLNNGFVQRISVIGIIPTVTISHVPSTSGVATTIRLIIRQAPGLGGAITWPASFKWPNATAPTLSGLTKTDIVEAVTFDGGTSWYARVLAQNYS